VTTENIKTFNFIQKNHLNKSLIKKKLKDFEKSIKETKEEINRTDKTLNVLNTQYKLNFKIKDLKKFDNFKTVVIIGMGGSILGAEAIYNFLSKKIKKKFYFFDNIDPEKNFFLKKKLKFKDVLFIIISKSGNTVETLANLTSLNILKRNSNNIIIITEKKNNPLFLIAKKFNLFYVEHRQNIGGRYSVLSEVGIIPSYLMGLNIANLRLNTLKYLSSKKKLFLKDSVLKLLSLFKFKKINNIVFINYVPDLEKFLFWCQQLIGESLGKKGKGFLPIISQAPKDHHSLLQLYLDGPKDKLFHIFSIDDKKVKKIRANYPLKKNHFLNKKSLGEIKTAQKNALLETFKRKNIPFREFKIKNADEILIGELFSYFILETILVAKMSKIDPYNQPGVEQVKILTKKFLS
tara:strand:+ start:2276 stop:3493 length:1218 start_codon:yes stop_codon:yes gene_type:complete